MTDRAHKMGELLSAGCEADFISPAPPAKDTLLPRAVRAQYDGMKRADAPRVDRRDRRPTGCKIWYGPSYARRVGTPR